MNIIEAVELTKVYPSGEDQIVALDHVSFTCQEGELVVILGASGAGKSTLLNILGGMDLPSSGQFVVGDKQIDAFTEKELSKYRRYDIGFVFQFYNLMPNLTALENVELAESVAHDPISSLEAITMVGLADRQNNFPSQLSGGEQQRVAIARAIVKNPLLLLCDEPTGALDSKTGRKIMDLLVQIAREKHKTVIIVTHNAALAKLADRLIRLSDGKIMENTLQTPVGVEEIEW